MRIDLIDNLPSKVVPCDKCLTVTSEQQVHEALTPMKDVNDFNDVTLIDAVGNILRLKRLKLTSQASQFSVHFIVVFGLSKGVSDEERVRKKKNRNVLLLFEQ
mmetsp:Transcript_62270/g.72431  ORF Transcript_62270/g.72431 Transcript_62270/m.72431 type:complete len:103 (-) Transcript_62270:12-320(-)